MSSSPVTEHYTKMQICWRFLFALTALINPFSMMVTAQSEPLVITNFSYFDSYSKTMARAQSMVIEDGKIASIDDDSYACPGCQTVNMEGGYIVPGLIDLHQHLGNGGFAGLDTNGRVDLFHKNLYWGITAVLNPSIPNDVSNALRSVISKNPERYPRFVTAGRTIGPKGGWGDLKTATVSGLKAAVDSQINNGASVIKLSYDDKVWLSGEPLPLFSEDALAAAIDYAHQRERRVFIHTTQVSLAKKAVGAGADGITTGLVVGTVDNELISMMKSRRTLYIATLSAFAAIENNGVSAKRQKAFDPALVNGDGLYQSLGSPIMQQNWRDWYPLSHAISRQIARLRTNTKRMIDAGLSVGLGTAAGTPGVIFGASLPDEMQRHVELGLHPSEALHMATAVNARLLYLSQQTGTIEVGKAADLVLLAEDPTQSIDAFKTIRYTLRGGRLHDRRDF